MRTLLFILMILTCGIANAGPIVLYGSDNQEKGTAANPLTVSFSGPQTISGDLTVTGSATISGDVTVTGKFMDIDQGIYDYPTGSGTYDWDNFDALTYSKYIKNYAGTDISTGMLGVNMNMGSAAVSGGHQIGALGIGMDYDTNNKNQLIGVEGRIDGRATTNLGYAVYGRIQWQDTSTGDTISKLQPYAGLVADGYILDHLGNTGRLSGTYYGLWVKNIQGGASNVSALIEGQTTSTTGSTMKLGKSTSNTLWVCYDQQCTTNAGGILFGSSADTQLYRSAVGTLTMNGTILASNVGIGTTAPQQKLEVDGGIYPRGGNYYSSDGTVGVTVTNCTGFKNGLCISGT